jgi:hypothetical protein
MSQALNAAIGAVASAGTTQALTSRLIDEMRAVADMPIEDTMRARLLLIAAAERLEHLMSVIEELEGEE